MAGTWIKVYDTITEHPKCVGLSDAAWTLWIHGVTYAGRNLSDGLIPSAVIRRLCGTRNPLKAAQELVDAGLWDVCDQGWMVHDYTEHQRTSEEAQAHRANSSKGATKANHVRWHEKRGTTDPTCQWCISGTDSDRIPIGIPRGREETEKETDDSESSSSTEPASAPDEDDDLATRLGTEDHRAALDRGTRIADPDAHRAACIQRRRDELASMPAYDLDATDRPPFDRHAHADCTACDGHGDVRNEDGEWIGRCGATIGGAA